MRDVWVVWVVISASGCGTGASDDTTTDAEETGTDTPIDPGPIVGTWELVQADLTLSRHP